MLFNNHISDIRCRHKNGNLMCTIISTKHEFSIENVLQEVNLQTFYRFIIYESKNCEYIVTSSMNKVMMESILQSLKIYFISSENLLFNHKRLVWERGQKLVLVENLVVKVYLCKSISL